MMLVSTISMSSMSSSSTLLTTVLFIFAFGLAAVHSQSLLTGNELTLDSILFKPFCENPLSKAAFDLCYIAASDSEANIVTADGTNTFSTARKGKVRFPFIPVIPAFLSPETISTAGFSIIPDGSDSVRIYCAVPNHDNIDPRSFMMIPASNDDSPIDMASGKVLDSNGLIKGYFIMGVFKKGALLYYMSQYLEVNCGWADTSLSRSEIIDFPFSYNRYFASMEKMSAFNSSTDANVNINNNNNKVA